MELETDIEVAFTKHARTKGVMALKLTILSNRDFPDRLVLCPKGKAFFIEFKLPDEEPRKGQLYIHRVLRRLGFNVYVCCTLKHAKEVLVNETLDT